MGKFKNHFKAILEVIDKTFPLHLWERLKLQAEATLNILRPTKIAPTISTYSYIYEQHNLNKMLVAPMGCVVLLHNKPDIRKTLDNHAIKGYYVKTSIKHYRCYKIWVKSTSSIQVTDTEFINIGKHSTAQLTTRSVKEFTAKYVVDNRTIYNILNQICKDKDLYPCVKKHTSPQETAEGHFRP